MGNLGERADAGHCNKHQKPLEQLFQMIAQKRGAVVEWLEQLEYGAESRRKVVSSRLGFAMRQLENSLCQPSSEWEPFSN